MFVELDLCCCNVNSRKRGLNEEGQPRRLPDTAYTANQCESWSSESGCASSLFDNQ